jgi:hypothetical protein
MQTDIKFLLVFLIIALAILIYYQNSGNNNIKKNNTDSLMRKNISNRENFDSNTSQRLRVQQNPSAQQSPRAQQSRRTQQSRMQQRREEFDSDVAASDSVQQYPQSSEHKQHILDKLINDINDKNSMNVDESAMNIYDNASNISLDEVSDYHAHSDSINKALPNTYKHHSYKAGNDGTNDRQKGKYDELDNYLADADVFKNTNDNNSSNFVGYNDSDSTLSDNSSGRREDSKYASPNIKDFSSRNNSQKDKIINLYNSNNYLPDQEKTNPKLTKGFQILENPVSVSNPNLIPVLKSIPVSSTLGSKKNSTYDIRAEPPNPKTVVSPFLNSDITPDIYSTNRPCL